MAYYNGMKNNLSGENLNEYMLKLKYASITHSVVKGLKETLRAIESGEAMIVYVAKCDNEDYMNLIKRYCDLYKMEIVLVDNWLELRDIVFICTPSAEIIENARKKGKVPNIKPKCYCAAIIDVCII